MEQDPSRQQFRHVPHVIRDARFHRRGYTKRAVQLAIIIKTEVERNRRFVVFELLAEPVR